MASLFKLQARLPLLASSSCTVTTSLMSIASSRSLKSIGMPVPPYRYLALVVDVQVSFIPTIGACIFPKDKSNNIKRESFFNIEGTFGFYTTFPDHPDRVYRERAIKTKDDYRGPENRTGRPSGTGLQTQYHLDIAMATIENFHQLYKDPNTVWKTSVTEVIRACQR